MRQTLEGGDTALTTALRKPPRPAPPQVRTDLLKVSAATLDRLLKPLLVQHPKGLSGTKPGSLLKTQISIRTRHWAETQADLVEADTVAHGNPPAGNFVWSLTVTDIVIGKTECWAT